MYLGDLEHGFEQCGGSGFDGGSGAQELEHAQAAFEAASACPPGPAVLVDVDVLQAAFEIPYATREALLPPGLHPTTPPL